MRGEDAEFDLRQADLQILKVIAFTGSSILTGPLMQVFIQFLQLCKNNRFYLHQSTNTLLRAAQTNN